MCIGFVYSIVLCACVLFDVVRLFCVYECVMVCVDVHRLCILPNVVIM